jgi:hypothetical protein
MEGWRACQYADEIGQIFAGERPDGRHVGGGQRQEVRRSRGIDGARDGLCGSAFLNEERESEKSEGEESLGFGQLRRLVRPEYWSHKHKRFPVLL